MANAGQAVLGPDGRQISFRPSETDVIERRKTSSPIRMFLRLYAHYRMVLVVLVVLGLAASLAETTGISLAVMLLTAALSKGIFASAGVLSGLYRHITHVFGDSPLTIGMVILGLVLIKAGCNFAYTIASSWMRHTMSHEVRQRIYAEYMDTAYNDIMHRDRGELVHVLSAESWSIADTLFTTTRILVNICSILVFGSFVLAISWKLAILAVIGAGLILLGMKLLSRPAEILSDEMVVQNALMTDQILADIQGMRAIRAFTQETQRKAAFRKTSETLSNLFMRIDRIFGFIGPLNEVCYISFLALLIGASSQMAIPASSVLASILLLYRLQPSLRELDNNRLALIGFFASLNVVKPTLDPRGRSYSMPGKLPSPAMTGGIVFEDVSYRFSDNKPLILSGLNITIPFGGVTVLTGRSGAGKSTIINMLLRLYDPTSGTISVDGIRLNNIRREDWLAKVAVAGQDIDLITGTIEENLTLSDPKLTLDDVHAIAEICEISEFIEHLPQGYQTRVGDRGLNLSGGQRQRLGLARALLRDPDVLILDEALGALQAKMERDIYERIFQRFSNATILVITHRPDSLPNPDHVVQIGG